MAFALLSRAPSPWALYIHSCLGCSSAILYFFSSLPSIYVFPFKELVFPLFSMSSNGKKFHVLSWNTRGLGNYDKCIVVRDAIKAAAPSVACLQETKLHDISSFKAKTFLPPNLSNTYLSFLLMVLGVGSLPPGTRTFGA